LTAYHPCTNGQTERVNQTLEQYLQCYSSYQQDNWVDYLPLAEFAYNNHPSSTTQQSPFYANFAFNLTFDPIINTDISIPTAEGLTNRLHRIREELVAELRHAQEIQARNFNRHALQPPPFNVGNQVWLLCRNIKTKHPSNKLNFRKLGPYTISAKRGLLAFQLDLPLEMLRLHPVFHVSLLEPYHPPTNIPGRVVPPPPPTFLDGKNSVPWMEVDKILDCRKIGRRFDYLVSWVGCSVDKNSWVHLSDLSTGLSKAIEQFHRQMTNRKKKTRPSQLDLFPAHPRLTPPINNKNNASSPSTTPDSNKAN